MDVPRRKKRPKIGDTPLLSTPESDNAGHGAVTPRTAEKEKRVIRNTFDRNVVNETKLSIDLLSCCLAKTSKIIEERDECRDQLNKARQIENDLTGKLKNLNLAVESERTNLMVVHEKYKSCIDALGEHFNSVARERKEATSFYTEP